MTVVVVVVVVVVVRCWLGLTIVGDGVHLAFVVLLLLLPVLLRLISRSPFFRITVGSFSVYSLFFDVET